MNDRPEDFEDGDIDMGEPVTDKLNVLLEELPDDWKRDDSDVDLGEPVTDKLHALLAALPEDWEKEDADADSDADEPVTDRLAEMLDELPGGDFSTRVRLAAEQRHARAGEPASAPHGVAAALARLVKRLFGGQD